MEESYFLIICLVFFNQLNNHLKSVVELMLIEVVLSLRRHSLANTHTMQIVTMK